LAARLIAINTVEQALDHLLHSYFGLDEPSLSMLPMIDFRSKLELIQDNEFLLDVVGRETRNRLHVVYDARNIIAHGYVDLPPSGGDSATASFSIKHSRRGRTLSADQIDAAKDEATDIVGSLLAAPAEIDEFLGPLRRYRAAHPELTAAGVLDRLRELIESRRAERGEAPAPP
jgi:hypothetical protein